MPRPSAGPGPADRLLGLLARLADGPQVVELRRLFNATIELFDKATNPLMTRAAATGGFGRKQVSNQGFGRI